MIRLLSSVFGGLFWFINILTALAACLSCWTSYSLPKHWVGGFLMLICPVLLAIQVFFLLFWAITRSWKMILSLVVLAFAYPLIKRSLAFNSSSKADTRNFTALSYNMMWCNDGNKSSNLIIEKAKNFDADIKCVQELLNYDDRENLNSIEQLKSKNPYYVLGTKGRNGSVGLAIFSKFPIVATDTKPFTHNRNGILQADIVLEGGDTVRVLNTQLFSMGIRVGRVLEAQANNNSTKAEEEAKDVLSKLKEGFRKRNVEVEELAKWVKNSPYPVLLCGDFNELPYGYAYGRMLEVGLQNAHQEVGFGFGFTYHRLPKFLRIDNQFYSPKLKALDFITGYDVRFSDHHPIWAKYGY